MGQQKKESDPPQHKARRTFSGDENAATTYFSENTTDSLKRMIMPIIKTTMEENSVAGYYNTFNDFYSNYINII